MFGGVSQEPVHIAETITGWGTTSWLDVMLSAPTLRRVLQRGDANPAQTSIVVHSFMRHGRQLSAGRVLGSLTASGDSPVPQALEVAEAEGGGRHSDRENLRSNPNRVKRAKEPGTVMGVGRTDLEIPVGFWADVASVGCLWKFPIKLCSTPIQNGALAASPTLPVAGFQRGGNPPLRV